MEEEDLIAGMRAMSNQLGRDTSTPAVASSLAFRNSSEIRYAQYYQRLVKAGLAPQLRKKYR